MERLSLAFSIPLESLIVMRQVEEDPPHLEIISTETFKPKRLKMLSLLKNEVFYIEGMGPSGREQWVELFESRENLVTLKYNRLSLGDSFFSPADYLETLSIDRRKSVS